MGIGFKFNLSPRFAVSAEYGVRKTFTDYIDDVSGTYADPTGLSEIAFQMADKSPGDGYIEGGQRGNPGTKDWYSFAGVILSYRVRRATSCSRH